MVVLGTVFAVIIAKQLYGGLGQNPFNPAMIGYVVLLISFLVQMTAGYRHMKLRSTSLVLSTPYRLFSADIPPVVVI